MKTLLLFLLALPTVQGELKPAQIAKRASPAVVMIKTSTPSGGVTASGFIVDPSGTILTNLHVIQGASSVAVKLPNGDVYDQVRVRAFDARKDLAVIQIAGFGLPTIETGNSDAVQAGEPVLLIGNPLGILEGSVSAGVVSAVRVLEGAGFRVIQTDAAANPGNSGGPLLDSAGRVIGVLCFKIRGAESLNFVIPINYARGLLASTESFSLDELGKRLAAASPDLFGPTKPQFPNRWKSITSGTTNILRVEGDHVYVDTVVPDEQRQAGAFNVIELTKSGDKYVGRWRGNFVCSWIAFTPFVGRQQQVNRCGYDVPIEFTLLTPTRIEGFSEIYPPNVKFDCRKCRWEKPRVRQSFTWIPE
jgi:S1-C subfamily serine protease